MALLLVFFLALSQILVTLCDERFNPDITFVILKPGYLCYFF
jgi:hypothetical protein